MPRQSVVHFHYKDQSDYSIGQCLPEAVVIRRDDAAKHFRLCLRQIVQYV